MSRANAILHGCCPRCRQGKIFFKGLKMNEHCPHCNLKFGREDGYFLGAMGVSYVLGLPVIFTIILVLNNFLLQDWPLYQTFIVSLLLYLPLIPSVVRYSRILWIHLDRYFDPGD